MRVFMEFIIVTGLSGAGKSRAVDALEDIGFYCVDNIPPKLIPTFYDLFQQSKSGFQHVAVVTDIRGGNMFDSLLETLDLLKEDGKAYKVLFLDANDLVLINRFKEPAGNILWREQPRLAGAGGQAGARDFAAGPGEGGLHHRHVVSLRRS